MTAKELGLDYFKFYDVDDVSVKFRVTLKTPFDPQPVPVELRALDLFANPVSKNGEPIFDKRAHLNLYILAQESREPTRSIKYQNQFGEFELRTGKPHGLLAPALKYEADLEFPKETGHYKLYRVVGVSQQKEISVKLRDQFRTEEAAIGVPVFFGVPVEKATRRVTYPIFNPKAHLVVYQITTKGIEKQIKVKDQFGERGLKVVRSVFLAVPSLVLRAKPQKG